MEVENTENVEKLQFETQVFQKVHSQEFHRRFFAREIRADGRAFDMYRETKVTCGGLATAEGSATVRIGRTTVVCGIRAEVCEPALATPDEGYLVPNLKLTPMCSSKFTPGPPGTNAQALSEIISSIFNNQVFCTKQLCIESGSAVWVLYADIVCLNYDGNVLDAAIIALLSALLDVRLPKATFDEASGSVSISSISPSATGETIPLTIKKKLYPCSFCLIDGKWALMDPSTDEEELSNTFFFILLDDHNRFVRIWKRGALFISSAETSNLVQLAQKRKASLLAIYNSL